MVQLYLIFSSFILHAVNLTGETFSPSFQGENRWSAVSRAKQSKLVLKPAEPIHIIRLYSNSAWFIN